MLSLGEILLTFFHVLPGRLKNTSDVIEAARRIADAGSRLDKLARAIAEVCPDSAVKQVCIV